MDGFLTSLLPNFVKYTEPVVIGAVGAAGIVALLLAWGWVSWASLEHLGAAWFGSHRETSGKGPGRTPAKPGDDESSPSNKDHHLREWGRLAVASVVCVMLLIAIGAAIQGAGYAVTTVTGAHRIAEGVGVNADFEYGTHERLRLFEWCGGAVSRWRTDHGIDQSHLDDAFPQDQLAAVITSAYAITSEKPGTLSTQWQIPLSALRLARAVAVVGLLVLVLSLKPTDVAPGSSVNAAARVRVMAALALVLGAVGWFGAEVSFHREVQDAALAVLVSDRAPEALLKICAVEAPSSLPPGLTGDVAAP